MEVKQDVSTVAGLRTLMVSLNKMEVPDDARVKGSGLRGGRIVLSVEVESEQSQGG